MSVRHILIIECEEGLQRILSLTLKRASFEVSVASTCAEAEEKISSSESSETPVDLLLIDMNFVEEHCDRLAGELSWPAQNVPIIVLVGYGEEDKIDKKFRDKCSLLISKPIEEKELIEGINKVLLHS